MTSCYHWMRYRLVLSVQPDQCGRCPNRKHKYRSQFVYSAHPFTMAVQNITRKETPPNRGNCCSAWAMWTSSREGRTVWHDAWTAGWSNQRSAVEPSTSSPRLDKLIPVARKYVQSNEIAGPRNKIMCADEGRRQFPWPNQRPTNHVSRQPPRIGYVLQWIPIVSSLYQATGTSQIS